MLLAVAPPVLGASAMNLLLLWVHAPEVIWILSAPPLIVLAFLSEAAVLLATRILPFLYPKVWNKQAMTERTPPPHWHNDSFPRSADSGPFINEGDGIMWNNGEKKKQQGKTQNLQTTDIDRLNPKSLKKN
jgi:hypothetical protein